MSTRQRGDRCKCVFCCSVGTELCCSCLCLCCIGKMILKMILGWSTYGNNSCSHVRLLDLPDCSLHGSHSNKWKSASRYMKCVCFAFVFCICVLSLCLPSLRIMCVGNPIIMSCSMNFVVWAFLVVVVVHAALPRKDCNRKSSCELLHSLTKENQTKSSNRTNFKLCISCVMPQSQSPKNKSNTNFHNRWTLLCHLSKFGT